MIDYLLIGPLGWDKSIWDKMLLNLKNKTVGFIEYMDHQDQDINEANLTKELQENINLLKETGVIIACSFGSRFFWHCMNQLNIKVKRIILIEGFQEIPAINLLNENLSNRSEIFKTTDEYLNTILDDGEKRDTFIKKAVLNTLLGDGSTYKVKCSNAKMLRYLSLLSEVKTEDLLPQIRDNKYDILIFSSDEIKDIPYLSTQESEHLLMLSNPQKIVKMLNI